jgi:hypothetical protein
MNRNLGRLPTKSVFNAIERVSIQRKISVIGSILENKHVSTVS